MYLWKLILLLLLIPSFVETNDIKVNSSVAAEANILLDITTSSISYCPGDLINITNQVQNIGNIPTIFILNTTTKNQYGALFANVTWSNQQVNPLEKKAYSLLKIVNESDIPGMYDVLSQLFYNNKKIENITNFRIKQSYGTIVSSPSFIEETVFPGDFISRDLYLWLLFPCYGVTVTLNKTGQIADWVYFSKNPVFLSPETWNVTKVLITIDLPWNAIPGDYTGNIIAYINNEAVFYIPITIHVQTTAIFDVQTEILSQYKEVCKGSEVKAKINLLKVFPYEPLDVNMTYIIQLGNTTYDQRKEVIKISDTLEKYITLSVPTNAIEGTYTFYGILDIASQNWKVNISSYDTFNVITCQPQLLPSAPGGGGGGKTSPGLEIETKKIEIKPNKYKIAGLIGSTSSFEVKIKNVGGSNITNIKLKIDGIPQEWLTVSPYKIDNLNAGKESEFLVFIKPTLNADKGVYQLSIKAKNSVESNEEKVLFILSSDDSNLTKMLYEQALTAKEEAEKTMFLSCLDISELREHLEEANRIFNLAKNYMLQEEYKKSQELFLKAMTDYDVIKEKAYIFMQERNAKIKIFGLPPFLNSIVKSRESIESSIQLRDYKSFCSNLNQFTMNTSYSILEAVAILGFVVYSIYYVYSKYKRYKERKLNDRLEAIKKRLDKA
ncbi:MAG: NEW3 domain-containing protein [Candidatus Aenigmatarchaeota archaeon]